MKIILTGGGTSGHITPNIALLPRLKSLGYEIHYIGTKTGIESQLISREGIPYHAINAGKLRRYLDLKNFSDILKIGQGFFQALKIIRQIRPNIVFSKGGFVSCPVVWAAWLNKIPVIIHESDITPGLANQLSMPFATRICFTFPETAKYLTGNKGVLTGIPVRENLFSGNRALGKELCAFTKNKPVIMVIGGSQGSETLNKITRVTLDTLLSDFQVCHLCGKGGIDPSLNNTNGYKQFEYVNEELPNLFALADLIISRSGATSLFEILALKKPNLLIPLSKQASRGDQILNARSFEKQGFSRVLMEEDLNEKSFIENINLLNKNQASFIKAMTQLSSKKGIDEVVSIITKTTN